MRKSILIGNLSDWINDLDSMTTGLSPIKAIELQDLLIHCRREIDNQQPEEDSETKKSAKEAIATHMAKLGIKE